MRIAARPSKEHEHLAEIITESLLNGDECHQTLKNDIKNVVAYFLRYTYIPIIKTDSKNKALYNAIKVFVSAPWIGCEVKEYVTAFKFLIQKEFLLLKSEDCRYQIKINKEFTCEDDDAFKRFISDAENEIRRREEYIKVSENDGDLKLRDAVEKKLLFNKKEKLTLKIIAYHGKTWLETDAWVNSMIQSCENLKLKILIVGNNPTIKVREGAEKKTHKSSTENGFKRLTKLYKMTRRRVDVRLYGEKDKYSYLRGAIIEDSKGDICYCHITCWRMGEERGNYGKDISIDNDVNLSYIVNSYFDIAFKKSQSIGSKFRNIVGTIIANKHWILSATVIAGIFVIKSIGEFFIAKDTTVAEIALEGIHAFLVFGLGVFMPIALTEYIDLHKDR